MLTTINDVSVMLLLIMHKLGEKVELQDLLGAAAASDEVSVMDFADAIEELDKKSLVEKEDRANKIYIGLNTDGMMIADEIKDSYFPHTMVNEALTKAYRYYESAITGMTYECNIRQNESGYTFTCKAYNCGLLVLCTDMFFEELYKAEEAKSNFLKNPRKVSENIMAMISGDIAYLSDI